MGEWAERATGCIAEVRAHENNPALLSRPATHLQLLPGEGHVDSPRRCLGLPGCLLAGLGFDMSWLAGLGPAWAAKVIACAHTGRMRVEQQQSISEISMCKRGIP